MKNLATFFALIDEKGQFSRTNIILYLATVWFGYQELGGTATDTDIAAFAVAAALYGWKKFVLTKESISKVDLEAKEKLLQPLFEEEKK